MPIPRRVVAKRTSVIRSTLIRMTRRIRNRAATGAAIALALFAGSAVAAGLGNSAEQTGSQRAIVIAGTAADEPATIAGAKATGQEVRVVHTTAEQLGVTHMLAARGYEAIETIGVDRRIAIAPVQQKFPHTRFVAAEADRPGQR